MKGNLQNIQPCKKLRDHFKMISVSVFFPIDWYVFWANWNVFYSINWHLSQSIYLQRTTTGQNNEKDAVISDLR